MSVINQMLRDLEQRKVTEAVDNHYIDEVNIIAKKKFTTPWMILSGFLVIAIALFLGALINNTTEIQQVKKLQSLPMELAEIAPGIKAETIPVVKDIVKDIVKDNVVAKDIVNNIANNKVKPVQITAIETKPVIPENKLPTMRADNNVHSPGYKQPSVKTKTILKPEPELVEKKLQQKAMALAKTAISSKTTSASPQTVRVKSVAKKKTTEQVIHQARQVMASDQNAAIQILEKNITQVLPDTDYYSLLANLQQRRHQYDESIVYYRKALDMADIHRVDKGELWIGIALAYRGTGEENNALQAFKQALISENISPELRQYASQQINVH